MKGNEKKCAILLDEVAIMKYIEYNKILDEIEGFEDLGTLGRTNKLGSQALVFMVRGYVAFIRTGDFHCVIFLPVMV